MLLNFPKQTALTKQKLAIALKTSAALKLSIALEAYARGFDHVPSVAAVSSSL